jgi:hypothetical protein
MTSEKDDNSNEGAADEKISALASKGKNGSMLKKMQGMFKKSGSAELPEH